MRFAPALLASMVAYVVGCSDDASELPDEGPACPGDASGQCSPGHACFDYVTDMSTGTQCRTLEGTGCAFDDCDCITKEMCDAGGASCDVVEGGVHVSNCFWGP